MPPDTQPTDEQLWKAESEARSAGQATTDVTQQDTAAAAIAAPAVAAENTGAAGATPAAQPSAVDLRIQELLVANQRLTDNIGVLQQQVNTAVGRVGALQSALDKQAAAPAQQPTNEQAQAALASPEAWKKFKDQFPDWTEAIESFVQANRAAGAPAQAAADPIDVNAVKQAVMDDVQAGIRQQTYAAVEAAHPGWLNTVQTPAFQEWRAKQPAEVNALGASPHAADAIRMMGLFKQSMAPADDVTQRREQLLQNSQRLTPTAPPAARTGAPRGDANLSEAEIWAQESKQRAEARARFA